MIKKVFIYGVLLAGLTLLLNLVEYKFIILDNSVEIYGGIIALIFAGFGIFLGRKFVGRANNQAESTIDSGPVFTTIETEKFGLSKREVEILELMAKGMSNQEISDHVFLSIHTVKSHISNMFDKLEVKRRTQAVQKAKEYRLIP